MNNFKSIGAEYVNEYSNSEDAWEFAFSNDQRIIDALTNNTPDDRAEAADEFGMGFADAYVGEPEVEKQEKWDTGGIADYAPAVDIADAVISVEKQAELKLAATAFTGDDGYDWLTDGADDAYLAGLDTEGVKAYVLDYGDIIWGGAVLLPRFEELTVGEFIAASDYDAAVTAVTEAVQAAKERTKESKMEVVKTKMILVGRHASDLPDNIDVTAQRNVTWPLDAQACMVEWGKLEKDAEKLGAGVLLQNVPGVLAVAMVRSEKLAREWDSPYSKVMVGVIISVPGPRTAGVATEYITAEPSLLLKALKDANGRAKIEIINEQRKEYDAESESAALISATVRLTVDPVTEFKFDHIEWM